MKKLFITAAVLFVGLVGFSQTNVATTPAKDVIPRSNLKTIPIILVRSLMVSL